MHTKSIIESVKRSIVPDPEYARKVSSKVHAVVKRINSCFTDADARLGGSGAKGTWLKTFDVDIFVLFNYSKYKEKSSQLSDILEKKISKEFKRIKRLHGSRDYFQISEGGFTFEIIPILKITKAAQAKNITDVSPLHSTWVKKHKDMIDEIRLTKQFCKANNFYGAESYIQGFSGYVCEILTIHYGSFHKLLSAAKKWKSSVVIDTKEFYKGKNIFLSMNKSKLVSPLIVVDPVQHDRNAAAALSTEKFDLLRTRSAEFLKNPSEDFFIEKHLEQDVLKREHKGKKIIVVKLKPGHGKEDVVGSKMMKVYEHLEQQLTTQDFTILESNWHWDRKTKALLYFVTEKKDLPPTKMMNGPPLRMKKHAENFKKNHKKTMIKNKKLYAIEKRAYRKPEALVKHVLAGNYVKERTTSSRFEVM